MHTAAPVFAGLLLALGGLVTSLRKTNWPAERRWWARVRRDRVPLAIGAASFAYGLSTAVANGDVSGPWLLAVVDVVSILVISILLAAIAAYVRLWFGRTRGEE